MTSSSPPRPTPTNISALWCLRRCAVGQTPRRCHLAFVAIDAIVRAVDAASVDAGATGPALHRFPLLSRKAAPSIPVGSTSARRRRHRSSRAPKHTRRRSWLAARSSRSGCRWHGPSRSLSVPGGRYRVPPPTTGWPGGGCRDGSEPVAEVAPVLSLVRKSAR